MATSKNQDSLFSEEVHSTGLAPLNIIRTETVLSRLPIHNLSKRGKVDIHIIRKNGQGEIDLHWDVSYNKKYGDARLLAYKLDTLIIDRRIHERGRPIPKAIYLGSLRSLARELGLNRDTNKVKQALRQNAFTGISAYLQYKGTDGIVRRLEGDFTRYEVWFYGEELPDGRKSDAVYIVFHDRYREVLNNAETRPLDYDYIKQLKPSSQRFYELISYKVYAAIKYQHKYARMLYSEYSTFAPQQQYYDYNQVKKQMYKVHRPHILSGYIQKGTKFEETTDSEGKPDWMMHYIPGPKAFLEYKTFTGKKIQKNKTKDEDQQGSITNDTIAEKDSANLDAIQLVSYFYKRFHDMNRITPNPRALTQAQKLITDHGLDKALFLVDFAYDAAQETNFKPELFSGILDYVPRAMGIYEDIIDRKRQQTVSAHCPFCDQNGYIVFEDKQGNSIASKCPHDLYKIQRVEALKGLTRIG